MKFRRPIADDIHTYVRTMVRALDGYIGDP